MRNILFSLFSMPLAFAAAVNYSYDAAGRLAKIDYGTAGSIIYTYDKAGNLLSRTVANAAAGAGVITKVNVAWGGIDIAPNTFIEIKGNNLVPASTPSAGIIWSNAPEFAQGKMPTDLQGVSVTVNGKPAYVYYYCSASTNPACATDQIDVLTGLDTTTGPVPVVVKSGGSSSAPFTVNVKALVPTFLFFNTQGYVVATHASFALLGPTSLYPGASTPAKPGEQIVLFAVGFGVPDGLTEGSSSQFSLLSGVACTVGNSPAAAAAALISVGLYQINVTVPLDAKTGNQAVSCSYKGSPTQAGAVLAVE